MIFMCKKASRLITTLLYFLAFAPIMCSSPVADTILNNCQIPFISYTLSDHIETVASQSIIGEYTNNKNQLIGISSIKIESLKPLTYYNSCLSTDNNNQPIESITYPYDFSSPLTTTQPIPTSLTHTSSLTYALPYHSLNTGLWKSISGNSEELIPYLYTEQLDSTNNPDPLSLGLLGISVIGLASLTQRKN